MTKVTGGPEKKTEGPTSYPSSKTSEPKGKKGYEPVAGGCQSPGCKTHASRFSFCDEHYDQFKFGLIKKSGELVSDYEKKFEHYTAWKLKTGQRVPKAA